MKKIILFGILFLIAISKVNSQNSFYDAIYLKKADTISKKIILLNDIQNLLAKYYPGKASTDITAVLLEKNPFFKSLFEDKAADFEDKSSFFSSVISSVGGLDVTNIADGLARFLIKRGKEELNIAFFSQFKQFIEKHDECKVLFPKTVEFLSKIQISKYAAFLQSLRENFYTDLNNLIIHLNQVVNLPKYDSLFKNHPEVKLVIGTASIVSELSQADSTISPDSVISQLAILPWSGLSKNVGTSLNFLNLISQSIRDTSKHRSWVQLSDLNKYLFTDSITLRIYFGLLYQQAQTSHLTFYHGQDSIRVDTILARQKDHIFTLSGLAENFSLLATDVEKTIEDIKTKKSIGALSDDDYYTYINKAINLIDYGFTITNTLVIDHSRFDIIHDRYIGVTQSANDLYKNIFTKNYGGAVTNVCSILDSLINDKHAEKVIAGILKYGNFMASIVKSTTPEDAETAIAAAALPAGSSSIKKNSAWTISLNAYIGGYFGKKINNTDQIDGNSSKTGITAPVGIALSKGLGNYKNGSVIGSLSLYATLIDVGAIAGYRLNDDSTALQSKITLNDIFAPGGYLVYGFGLPFMSYVPLSVGYGWQYGSKLYYKKSAGELGISDKSRWRSNWFIAIDIPLANFWTKSYKK